jgi:hypothetical protein
MLLRLFTLLMTATMPLLAAAEERDFWARLSDDTPPPPEVQPFEVPTFDGEAADFREEIPPLIPAPKLDADRLYQAAIDCYPSPSTWRIDIGLKTGYRTKDLATTTTDNIEVSEIGGLYAKIVARMPLYSTTEIDREREREYQRRVEVAKLVGELVQAAAKRHTAHRQLGLYSALERRAQVRVQRGIVPASEQVDYLEKVIKAHEEIIAQDAAITEKRLALVGGCRPEASDTLNRYLQAVLQLPPPQPAPRPSSARAKR